jgi:hypothetical protein
LLISLSGKGSGGFKKTSFHESSCTFFKPTARTFRPPWNIRLKYVAVLAHLREDKSFQTLNKENHDNLDTIYEGL